jgi:hypothetical protein
LPFVVHGFILAITDGRLINETFAFRLIAAIQIGDNRIEIGSSGPKSHPRDGSSPAYDEATPLLSIHSTNSLRLV